MKKIISLVLSLSLILTLLMAFTVSYGANLTDVKFTEDEIPLKGKITSAVVKTLEGTEIPPSGANAAHMGGGIAVNVNERFNDG